MSKATRLASAEVVENLITHTKRSVNMPVNVPNPPHGSVAPVFLNKDETWQRFFGAKLFEIVIASVVDDDDLETVFCCSLHHGRIDVGALGNLLAL